MSTTQPTKKRSYVRERAAEPSSWNGVALALLAGMQAYQGTGSKTVAVISALAAVLGVGAAVVPDRKG